MPRRPRRSGQNATSSRPTAPPDPTIAAVATSGSAIGPPGEDVYVSDDDWNPQLATERLLLTPLVPADADELVGLLNDQRLHRFTGGDPADIGELRRSFELWAGRVSPDGRERWLNWVIRERRSEQPLGTLQATVRSKDPRLVTEVAWVLGVEAQGQRYASEAARALVGFLLSKGAREVIAHIHPDHEVSARVASAVGMGPTEEWSSGERLWRLSSPSI